MNRIVKIFLILVVCFSFKTVYAENYKLKEFVLIKKVFILMVLRI